MTVIIYRTVKFRERSVIMNDNKSIIKRLKKHDEDAFDIIIKKYLPLVTSIIYNIGRGSLTTEDVEEAAMDTFYTVWKNTDKIQEGTLKGYICTIAKTKAFDKLDSTRRINESDGLSDEEEDSFSIELALEQKEAQTLLYEVINTLEEPDREIVIRYYYWYQRTVTIAEKTGLTTDNVKVRLHRARKKIKAILEERGYDL